MRTFVLVSVVALVAALGCDKKKPSGDKTSTAGTGSAAPAGSAPAPATPPGTVEIFVNGASVAKVAPDAIQKWPRLDSLVPAESRRLGTWVKVKLVGAKTEEVPNLSTSYPDMAPVLFPGENGKPSFGIFEPVALTNKGKPGLRSDDIREIRIEISTEERPGMHQGGGEIGDPTKIVIEVETPQGKSKLTGPQILALPREDIPGPREDRGWRLQQLLDLAGIKKFEQIVLADNTGSSVIVERKDLEAKEKTIPFIKLNKSGHFRVRVLKQAGAGWKTGGELRELTLIKVAK